MTPLEKAEELLTISEEHKCNLARLSSQITKKNYLEKNETVLA